MSMPAAELFGAWAVPQAAIDAGMLSGPVYAVCDCDPAVGALNAARSSVPQMRELVRAARQMTPQWLAVSVPREANIDADRLSHPRQLGDVQREALEAGLVVHHAHISEESWRVLRRAAYLGGWGVAGDTAG